MKLTKQLIKLFESDQKNYGTEVALYNWQWMQAAKLFKDLGITSIHAHTKKPRKRGSFAFYTGLK